MTDKEKIRSIIELFIAWNGETETIDVANLDSAADFIADSLQEEPVSEELEEAAKFYADTHTEWFDADGNPHVAPAFKVGAKWQKEHLWKPSKGQMEALKEACNEHYNPKGELYSLYEQLEAL